nr:UDP-GlcNAc:betaGal beta-1,3-N-acetylglucosaminyltransferase-like protein 1 [Vulpes vulpes]
MVRMLVRVPIARSGCWFTVRVHSVGARCWCAVSVVVHGVVLVCCARCWCWVRKSGHGHRHRHELRPVLRRPARSGLQSIILPVHNAERWLHECLRSVLQQDFAGPMELSVFNDASKDQSLRILEEWKVKLEDSGIPVVIGGHESPYPRGVGYSKNQAIAQSSGSYLCFLDSDDVMMPQRVRLQLDAATRHPTSIIGCQVRREPPDSTERYTRWINQLAPEQLLTQVFTSHGPTVVMPTWFCSRTWFSHVGPFDEGGQGVPEDLLLFYNHLRKGGGVVRVDRSLVLYRYHPDAATHSVLETTIWTHRVRFLEERVLPHWAAFTIWNAGRQGRRLYRSLSAGARRKPGPWELGAVGAGPHPAPLSPQETPKPRVPILHFRAARPPFVICVKLDLTGGEFEANLRSLNLREGRDFLHFS